MADCNICTDCTQEPTVPLCPDTPAYTNNVCPDTPSSDCIIYEGGENQCIPIIGTGDNKPRITQVIKNIITYISTFFSRITSNSLSIVRNGDCADSLSIEIIPSSDINNTFLLGTDGKPFVRKTDVGITDSQCITWQKQVSGSTITFVPIIDFACVSAQVCPICDSSAVPCVGTNISITGVNQTHAVINFTQDLSKTYQILVNNISQGTGISTPYTLNSLTPGTNYSVTIVTDCGSGNTSQSVSTFSTLPVISCNIPSNLQISLA